MRDDALTCALLAYARERGLDHGDPNGPGGKVSDLMALKAGELSRGTPVEQATDDELAREYDELRERTRLIVQEQRRRRGND